MRFGTFDPVLALCPAGIPWEGTYQRTRMSDEYGYLVRRFFVWWLFGGVVAMIIGAVLNYCENSVVVKCVRIFLNLALLFAIYFIISVFEQHHFRNTAGAFVLFAVAVFNLVLAIAMAFPRKKDKAVRE